MSLDVSLYQSGDLEDWNLKRTQSLKEAEGLKGLIPLIEQYYEDRKPEEKEVYDSNITHNLRDMADAAGLFGVLWYPEERGILTAKQLIEPLQEGLELLKSRPDTFKYFNPKNGWGDYDGFVRFVKNYLEACNEYPDAKVKVWR